MITRYSVHFKIAGQDGIYAGNVVTGPKTDERDIPRILAIKRGLSEDDITVLDVRVKGAE